MPRPPNCRRIGASPTAAFFKPAGIPTRDLEIVVVTLDEFEAIRLADGEGLYQAQAAERMGVSRATFGRIVDGARRKIADVLLHGKALRIDGGPVHATHAGPSRCGRCGLRYEGDAGADCAKHASAASGGTLEGAEAAGTAALGPRAGRRSKNEPDA